MIVKEYKNFNDEERKQSQSAWEEILDTYCTADEETGCRPCDRGCPCDRCHYDYDLQRKYSEMLVERNIPLTPREASYLND